MNALAPLCTVLGAPTHALLRINRLIKLQFEQTGEVHKHKLPLHAPAHTARDGYCGGWAAFSRALGFVTIASFKQKL